MGQKRSYSWECKLQMIRLLEKGEQNPSQISRDHHVTRSVLYVWWQLYQERGEAACVPTQAEHASASKRACGSMRTNRLPIWSGFVDNRRWNWICSDRR
jgi:transposase-like protein